MRKLAPVRNTDTTEANAKRMVLADEFARYIHELVQEDLQYDIWADPNVTELNNYQLVKALNNSGEKTRTGKKWTQNTVKLLRKRMKELGLEWTR